MKRNYDAVIGRGLRAPLPPFMCPKNETTEPCGYDSDKDQASQNEDEPPEGASNVQEIQNLKETPKEPAEENHDWNPIPVTFGSEQDEKQLSLLEAASNSGQQSMKTSSKRKLFGNPSSGSPGCIQVCGPGGGMDLGQAWVQAG
ncbi:putative protein SSX8 [Manis pentadactyla]|uniref:putative protein SSX8 n=1 Tax=Manis pentadactyla TaxID=143292 RepID=UPI00255C6CB2|nr:putative protein SSX8 [Manis pentadactyla]